MQTKFLSKALAMILAVIMLVSVLPMSAFAAVDYDEQDDDYYKVISQKNWELAPGIVESEIVINNDAGDRRQVMHVVEVDIHNEYTKVIPSSKGMIPTPGQYGVETMDKQAAYAEANGYGNVVAAMNISLSWYDSAYYDEHPELAGEPLGYLILDGVQYTNSQGQTAGAQSCLVINFDEKNGEARPADMPKTQIRSTSDPITGWEEQVIPANFGFLVKDGKMVHTTEEHTSEGASRSMIGIKADGSIVMVMNDGRQAPYSTGFNNYEMSEAMLKLGCVYAINGDGGGSSQFLSQRPGEELTVNCSPSDGALRATTHGVLVISTAPSTGEFVRAHVETEHEYYTPNSSVQFTAIGTDLVGTATEIPAEAYWQLADASYGTIDANGLFTSNGKAGEVVAQLVYEGEVKGSASIFIVNPDAIAFGSAAAYTVPFGESVNINVTATYGIFDVTLNPSDYTITFADTTLGTLSGNTYTAGNAAGTTTMTVTLNSDPNVSKTIPLTIGKGSEVIFDFEVGTEGANLDNWVIKSHEGKVPYYSDISIVTSENGMVHNGNTALAVHIPTHLHVDGSEGYSANSITWVGDRILLENAIAIGMWIYIPEEATQTEIALNYVWYNAQGVQQRTTPDLCLNDDFNNIESSGWYYLSVPISQSIAYIEDAKDVAASQGFKRNFFLKFYITNSGNAGDESSYFGDITYYIDDVTVDYSDAVADRVNPTIGATNVKNISVDSDVALSAGSVATLAAGDFNFTATVTDNIAIDASTAKVFVDGKLIPATCKNGRIASADISLNAGTHRIVYEIADTMGNTSRAIRYIRVSGTDIPVNVAPQNPDATVALTGSVYWLDIVANNTENIDTVTLKLDLDTMNTWELEYAELANNYEIAYYYASTADKDDNLITIVLTNKGSDLSGNAVIASLPIRVWAYQGNIHSSNLTPAQAWTTGFVTAVSVNVETEYGEVVYKDGSNNTFSADEIHIDTEAYVHQYKMDKTYFANNTYHVHTATAMDDRQATCTQSGYTGRTFCSVCNSVVDWGTVTAASGHEYEVVDGKLTCVNGGELFNGVYTDGKTYVDGVAADGWVDESYYKEGQKLIGVHMIDGKYYEFDENGICPGKLPKSLWYTNEAGESFYLDAGIPMTQYAMINSTPTFFDDLGVAYQGEFEINGEICVFDKGAFVESTTAEVLLAGRCGPKANFVLYADGTFVLCGEGATWDFVSVGQSYLPNLSWKNRPWGNQNNPMSQKIKKVIIGKDITVIGERFVLECYNVEAVEFEEGSKLVEIKQQAFHYLNKITTLVLPDGVSTLGVSAFGYCKALVNVRMPELVEKISTSAFQKTNANLKMNVVKDSFAEEYAIANNFAYETRESQYKPGDILPSDVLIAEGTCGENATWALYTGGKLIVSGSGAIANYAQSTAPWSAYGNDIKSVKIGKNITVIGSHAFSHLYNLKLVVFEEGSQVHTLSSHAFHYAMRLTEITLPDSITTIGFTALGYGKALTSITMPELVTEINKDAFLGRNANLVLNVTEGSYAEEFAKANNIAYETREAIYGPTDILPSDTLVDEGVCGENAIWKLYTSGKLVVSGSGAIANYEQSTAPWSSYYKQITCIIIGKDITVIGTHAFSHLYSVKSILFEEGSKLTTLSNYAFHYAMKVKEITLPETVTYIGFTAMGYCSNLESVYIPELVTYINSSAFLKPNASLVLNVTEGTIAEDLAKANNIAYETREAVYGPGDALPTDALIAEGTCGENATWKLYEGGKLIIGGSGIIANYAQGTTPWADYYNQIKSVKIGKDITYIGSYAFSHLYKLETIVFEEGSQLTGLANHAFHYAMRVKSVVLPDSVETIGFTALGYCTDLVSVQMPSNLSSIHAQAILKPNANLVLAVEEGSIAEAFAIANNIAYTYR